MEEKGLRLSIKKNYLLGLIDRVRWTHGGDYLNFSSGEELINKQLVSLLSVQMGDREALSQQAYLSYFGAMCFGSVGPFSFALLFHICSFLERAELIIECLDRSPPSTFNDWSH